MAGITYYNNGTVTIKYDNKEPFSISRESLDIIIKMFCNKDGKYDDIVEQYKKTSGYRNVEVDVKECIEKVAGIPDKEYYDGGFVFNTKEEAEWHRYYREEKQKNNTLRNIINTKVKVIKEKSKEISDLYSKIESLKTDNDSLKTDLIKSYKARIG